MSCDGDAHFSVNTGGFTTRTLINFDIHKFYTQDRMGLPAPKRNSLMEGSSGKAKYKCKSCKEKFDAKGRLLVHYKTTGHDDTIEKKKKKKKKNNKDNKYEYESETMEVCGFSDEEKSNDKSKKKEKNTAEEKQNSKDKSDDEDIVINPKYATGLRNADAERAKTEKDAKENER